MAGADLMLQGLMNLATNMQNMHSAQKTAIFNNDIFQDNMKKWMSIPAQVKQMQEAGLNPALAGGSPSVGAAPPGTASAPQMSAPSVGEIANARLIESQKANIDEDTKVKQANRTHQEIENLFANDLYQNQIDVGNINLSLGGFMLNDMAPLQKQELKEKIFNLQSSSEKLIEEATLAGLSIAEKRITIPYIERQINLSLKEQLGRIHLQGQQMRYLQQQIADLGVQLGLHKLDLKFAQDTFRYRMADVRNQSHTLFNLAKSSDTSRQMLNFSFKQAKKFGDLQGYFSLANMGVNMLSTAINTGLNVKNSMQPNGTNFGPNTSTSWSGGYSVVQ